MWCRNWTQFLTNFSTARPSRQETGQLPVPVNTEQKSLTTGAPSRKKKSMGIRALSGKQRKEDHIRALLKEHLNEIQVMLQPQKSFQLEVSVQSFALLVIGIMWLNHLKSVVYHKMVKLRFSVPSGWFTNFICSLTFKDNALNNLFFSGYIRLVLFFFLFLIAGCPIWSKFIKCGLFGGYIWSHSREHRKNNGSFFYLAFTFVGKLTSIGFLVPKIIPCKVIPSSFYLVQVTTPSVTTNLSVWKRINFFCQPLDQFVIVVVVRLTSTPSVYQSLSELL